jgi:hypothetical protein
MSVVQINHTRSSHKIHKITLYKMGLTIVNTEHVKILQCSPYTL